MWRQARPCIGRRGRAEAGRARPCEGTQDSAEAGETFKLLLQASLEDCEEAGETVWNLWIQARLPQEGISVATPMELKANVEPYFRGG